MKVLSWLVMFMMYEITQAASYASSISKNGEVGFLLVILYIIWIWYIYNKIINLMYLLLWSIPINKNLLSTRELKISINNKNKWLQIISYITLASLITIMIWNYICSIDNNCHWDLDDIISYLYYCPWISFMFAIYLSRDLAWNIMFQKSLIYVFLLILVIHSIWVYIIYT